MDEDILDRCISSILKTKWSLFEIILVDNASANNSLNYVVQKYVKDHRLKIIRNSSNLGYCEGNNVGIRLAHGEFIALLNPDTEVHPDWLQQSMKEFESTPSLGIVQPKILMLARNLSKDIIRTPYILSAGNHSDICGFAYKPVGLLARDDGRYDSGRTISYADGSAVVIRKTVLEKVGLLDTDFVFYGDTLDLCWRAWICDFCTKYVPRAKVYHYGGVSLWKIMYYRRFFYLIRNQTRILIKNLELGNLLKIMPLTVTYLSLYCLYNMKKGNIMIAYAVLNALSDNVAKLKSIWKKRVTIQLVRNVTDKELLKKNVFLGQDEFLKQGMLSVRAGHRTLEDSMKQLRQTLSQKYYSACQTRKKPLMSSTNHGNEKQSQRAHLLSDNTA